MTPDFFQENDSDKKNRKVGLYTTLIFHLLLLIVLLSTGIGTLIKEETSFVMDFTKIEEAEKRMLEEKKKIKLKDEAAKELEKILGAAPEKARNAVADRSSKESKFDMKEVYADNAKLQDRLRKSKKQAQLEKEAEEAAIAAENAKNNKKSGKDVNVKGRVFVAYELDGRQRKYLPTPAYTCAGAGEVSVAVTVDYKGRVVKAEVIDGESTPDDCLRENAVRFAKISSFEADDSGKYPKKHVGTITYVFEAQ